MFECVCVCVWGGGEVLITHRCQPHPKKDSVPHLKSCFESEVINRNDALWSESRL